MNMDTIQLKQQDVNSVVHPFSSSHFVKQFGPLVIDSGTGCYLTDIEGNRMLSADAGLGATVLGFGHSAIAETMAQACKQLGFQHTAYTSSNSAQIRLASRLLQHAPEHMGKVFFGTSGSDANESAIKIIRLYNTMLEKPQKRKIIARKFSYHGSTLSTGALTRMDCYRDGFSLDEGDVIEIGCPHYESQARDNESVTQFTDRLIAELETAIANEGADHIAAFIAEPVQGGGGALVPTADYFKRVKPILEAHDILFIADEVICGFGRLGSWWGIEQFGVEPDIITCAKALTNGCFPMSAVIFSNEIWQVIEKNFGGLGLFFHGFTSSGHPIGSAVALTTLDCIENEKLVDRSAETGAYLQQRLSEVFENHPHISDIRGMGLMVAFDVYADPESKERFAPELFFTVRVMEHCRRLGLIVRTGGLAETLLLVPPLVISRSEVDELVELLSKGIDATIEEILPVEARTSVSGY